MNIEKCTSPDGNSYTLIRDFPLINNNGWSYPKQSSADYFAISIIMSCAILLGLCVSMIMVMLSVKIIVAWSIGMLIFIFVALITDLYHELLLTMLTHIYNDNIIIIGMFRGQNDEFREYIRKHEEAHIDAYYSEKKGKRYLFKMEYYVDYVALKQMENQGTNIKKMFQNYNCVTQTRTHKLNKMMIISAFIIFGLICSGLFLISTDEDRSKPEHNLEMATVNGTITDKFIADQGYFQILHIFELDNQTINLVQENIYNNYSIGDDYSYITYTEAKK